MVFFVRINSDCKIVATWVEYNNPQPVKAMSGQEMECL